MFTRLCKSGRLLALVIPLLSGCGSIPIYRLPVSAPAEPLLISDARAEETKLIRPVGNGHSLGDVFLVPPPLDLVAAGLLSDGDTTLYKKKLTLSNFAVSIIEGGKVDAAEVGRAAAPVGGPPGAAILAYGIISLIEHARRGTMVRAELSISADDATCNASAFVVTRTGVRAEQIRDVVFAAATDCRRQWSEASAPAKKISTLDQTTAK